MNSGEVTEKLVPALRALAPDKDPIELERLAESLAMEILLKTKSHAARDYRVGKYKTRDQIAKVNRLAGQLGEAIAFDKLGTEGCRTINLRLKDQDGPLRAELSDRIVDAAGSVLADVLRANADNPEARTVINDVLRDIRAPDLERIQDLLVQICAATKAAHEELAALPNEPTRSHRPPRNHPLAVAKVCARYFEFLTGKRPGRSVGVEREGGRFLEFLRAVFSACGIKASPENTAKNLIDGMEKRQTIGDQSP